MAGRRKKQQKRKEKSSSSSPPASPSPASSGDPAASPASPSASTNDASPPRGPERLSQNDWAEIERQNAIAAAAKAAAPGPGPARDGILDKLLSSDAMLLFAVDGVCPELVNGRVAMFGFFTALIKELVTGQSFTTQLAYNLTHGVSPTIIALVLVGTLAPSFMADAKETPWTGGDGVARYNDDATAKGKRRYLCDPRALDVRRVHMIHTGPHTTAGLPGIDSPVGRLGFAPVAELWNGRAAMTGLILTFVIEGALGHGIFRA
ncbi:uncharacterized protein MICPUCDRAFT_54682 [Micromonas pusilla CCMP1545]|uniref:Predicted protein n=1 Tax=Micromonas pusilla (strain CCMP1545) TaxID=564608 RepID=C1N9X8_MICPC|nr:uncharacterized protein MICPUCDRAFT_54682 [Micromonas pusilla CCMP1545]EEH51027.1 predicted protein [Micromonas pusilla CCMP1545]|eukprot:XP_003064693.1 predicted protein [Micromonas pusilla CCMP1545]